MKTRVEEEINEEINESWADYARSQSQEARTKLVKFYLPLVRYVASRIMLKLPMSVQYADLVSAGTVGLLQAIEKFDLFNGTKFETYAVPRIRGAMLDELRQADSLSRLARKRLEKIKKAIQFLEQRNGDSPTDKEIIKQTGIDEGTYYNLLAETKRAVVVPIEEISRLYEIVPDELFVDKEAVDMLEGLIREETLMGLIKAMEILSDNERLVLVLHYYKDMTLKDISLLMGVSDSMVSQHHMKAIRKIRKFLKRNE